MPRRSNCGGRPSRRPSNEGFQTPESSRASTDEPLKTPKTESKKKKPARNDSAKERDQGQLSCDHKENKEEKVQLNKINESRCRIIVLFLFHDMNFIVFA